MASLERTRCPKCRRRAPRGALGCDTCEILFGEWEAEQAARLEGLSPAVAERIADIAVKRFFRWRVLPIIVVGLGIIGFGFHEVLQYADRQIAERFAEPHVRDTFERVVTRAAEDNASRLIHEKVDPSVQHAQQFIADEKTALASQVDEIRSGFQSQLEDLRQQSAFWTEARKIMQWEDRALDGDPGALEALRSYQNDDPDLRSRAYAAALSIHGFYLLKTRALVKISVTNADGSHREEENLTTAELIRAVLDTAVASQIRVRAARLLAGKHEQGVPEALLQAMQTDRWLWVRHEALTSFEAVTGWDAGGALQFEAARLWWSEHAADVTGRLAPQATATSASTPTEVAP